jgi:hypothetical protein
VIAVDLTGRQGFRIKGKVDDPLTVDLKEVKRFRALTRRFDERLASELNEGPAAAIDFEDEIPSRDGDSV